MHWFTNESILHNSISSSLLEITVFLVKNAWVNNISRYKPYLKCNQNVVGYSSSIHTTIVPVSISHKTSHHCCSQGSLLGQIDDFVFTKVVCIILYALLNFARSVEVSLIPRYDLLSLIFITDYNFFMFLYELF